MARSPRRPTAPNPLDELTELAVNLDLTALGAVLSELLQRAEHESLSYTDFALALLRTELNARKNRRLERSLKQSHLGSVEGLDGFNYAIRPQLDPRVVKELLNARFAEERRNVLCLGNPGLGKTRVAKAIVHAACLAGYSTLCVLTVDMLEDLQASRANHSFARALRRYVKPQVLLLDEFGHAGPFDTVASHYLFRVVGARHQQGSIGDHGEHGLLEVEVALPIRRDRRGHCRPFGQSRHHPALHRQEPARSARHLRRSPRRLNHPAPRRSSHCVSAFRSGNAESPVAQPCRHWGTRQAPAAAGYHRVCASR